MQACKEEALGAPKAVKKIIKKFELLRTKRAKPNLSEDKSCKAPAWRGKEGGRRSDRTRGRVWCLMGDMQSARRHGIVPTGALKFKIEIVQRMELL